MEISQQNISASSRVLKCLYISTKLSKSHRAMRFPFLKTSAWEYLGKNLINACSEEEKRMYSIHCDCFLHHGVSHYTHFSSYLYSIYAWPRQSASKIRTYFVEIPMFWVTWNRSEAACLSLSCFLSEMTQSPQTTDFRSPKRRKCVACFSTAP